MSISGQICRARNLTAVLIVCLALPYNSVAKTPIPDQLRSAKTIYLVNQTKDDHLIETAVEKFTNWGRFTITQSKDDADLVVVFREKQTMDKWGNVGKIYMDVYLKGEQQPTVTTTSALHLAYDFQHRTKACIQQFRELLEAKN